VAVVDVDDRAECEQKVRNGHGVEGHDGLGNSAIMQYNNGRSSKDIESAQMWKER